MALERRVTKNLPPNFADDPSLGCKAKNLSTLSQIFTGHTGQIYLLSEIMFNFSQFYRVRESAVPAQNTAALVADSVQIRKFSGFKSQPSKKHSHPTGR